MLLIANNFIRGENKMTNQNLELKINALNQLALLKNSTFKDKLCFLDEDIQNAQRAKAKTFKVCFEEQNIIIENDGDILDDPQCLFSIAESGWGDEIKQNENSFGTGFFSNIGICDNIDIYTGYKHIVFDVNTMLKNQDSSVYSEESDEYYNGFKLILNKVNLGYYDVKGRVEKLGNYVHELDVYFEGMLIEKKDLIQSQNKEFEILIDDIGVKGSLYITESFSSGINLFHKGRLIKTLGDIWYIKGDLHLDGLILNLTSPDRKDIIKDSKYSEFEQLIKMYIKEMCTKAAINGNSEAVAKYEEGISFYVSLGDVKNEMKFSSLSSTNEKEIGYLEGIAISQKSENKDSEKEYLLMIDGISKKESLKETENEIESYISIESTPKQAKGVYTTSGSYSSGVEIRPEIKKTHMSKGKILKDYGDEIIFWMELDKVLQYEKQFNIMKHYNLKTIIAKNKIEADVLREISKENNNINHINELKEDIEVIANLSNTTLKPREQRAEKLFNMIFENLGMEDVLLLVGDLMVKKKVYLSGTTQSYVIDDDVVVVADINNYSIMMDRVAIDRFNLLSNTDELLNLDDYKFILANYKIIAQEVSLLNENYSIEKVENDIIRMLANAL